MNGVDVLKLLSIGFIAMVLCIVCVTCCQWLFNSCVCVCACVCVCVSSVRSGAAFSHSRAEAFADSAR